MSGWVASPFPAAVTFHKLCIFCLEPTGGSLTCDLHLFQLPSLEHGWEAGSGAWRESALRQWVLGSLSAQKTAQLEFRVLRVFRCLVGDTMLSEAVQRTSLLQFRALGLSLTSGQVFSKPIYKQEQCWPCHRLAETQMRTECQQS